MTFKIGLRVYQLTIREKYESERQKIVADGGKCDLLYFIRQFVTAFTKVNDQPEIQRSWFFEESNIGDSSTICGYINYGTYGFESRLIDVKTRKASYTRKTSDLEEIPLYFQFWVPKNGDFGFAVFQSFQARSCVSLVLTSMQESFQKKNNPYLLNFKKLMPSDVKGSKIFSAPVKELTLIKKGVPRDSADAYLQNIKAKEYNVELTVKAKRRSVLGALIDFVQEDDTAAIVVYDGIEFDEVKANVLVGGRRRTVGVIGYHSDAGVIDITGDVEFGLNGHPKFASVHTQAEDILKDFYETLSKSTL